MIIARNFIGIILLVCFRAVFTFFSNSTLAPFCVFAVSVFTPASLNLKLFLMLGVAVRGARRTLNASLARFRESVLHDVAH